MENIFCSTFKTQQIFNFTELGCYRIGLYFLSKVVTQHFLGSRRCIFHRLEEGRLRADKTIWLSSVRTSSSLAASKNLMLRDWKKLRILSQGSSSSSYWIIVSGRSNNYPRNTVHWLKNIWHYAGPRPARLPSPIFALKPSAKIGRCRLENLSVCSFPLLQQTSWRLWPGSLIGRSCSSDATVL